MSSTIGLYAKALTAAVVAALTSAVTGLTDGSLTGAEWVAVAVALFGNLGLVWLVPNAPSGLARYGKAGTAAVLGFLGAFATALTDGGPGVTSAEWLTVAIATLTAAGLVAAVPNAVRSDYARAA